MRPLLSRGKIATAAANHRELNVSFELGTIR